MISPPDRVKAVTLIDEAVEAGARRWKACLELGIHARTYRRWTSAGGVRGDARPEAVRPVPSTKLTEAERSEVLAICHAPAFASLPPSQIVPTLADQGRYVACESSFYRILHDADEQHHRGRAQAPRRQRAPRTHCASDPCEVWCWDVSFLRSPVVGLFYRLYMIVDLYSRKIVGWEIHEQESGEYAAALVHQAVLREGCIDRPLILHADNGAIQRGYTLRCKLEQLGIEPSYSRPRVSDDNAYSESLFRTCKYRPDYPVHGFESIEAARQWMQRF
ncbi:MAG: transposase [Gammaproteobacteria bacterium]